MLQWGRANEGAEIPALLISIRAALGELQWGRANEGAEIYIDIRSQTRETRASMGPRQ